MDIKEKRRQYYINNRDRILQLNKQYYYDNREERQKYNNEYWSLNGHKYVQKRAKDKNVKTGDKEYYNNNKQNYYNNNKEKQRQYYKIHYQKNKDKIKCLYYNNNFNPPSKKDFIVRFSF